MTKVLVTGGAGFIGSNLAAVLLTRGETVRVLDNFSTGRRENLEGLDKSGLEVVEGDLRDPCVVKDALRNIDLVFHEAAFVSAPLSLREPRTCYEINVRGTENLLEAAQQAGVRRIVLASSAAIYGDSTQFPLDEESRLQPLSPYAASKAINEISAGMYTRSFNLEVVALRYFNVYGPKQSLESEYAAAIPIFIRQLMDGKPITIYGDGEQTRDLVFIEDVVQANLLAASSKKAAGEYFNVCSGQEISMLQLVQILQEITGHRSDLRFEAARPGDILRSTGRPDKARSLLGFLPKVALRAGLKRTLDWMYPG